MALHVLWLLLNFLLELCYLEIYFCVHRDTCCYPNISAGIFSCFLLPFQNSRVSPHLFLQDHLACCLLHFMPPAIRGRIPAYTSHSHLLIDIAFKELSRLLTSTEKSFQSDILTYNKASYPIFVKCHTSV